MRVCRFSLDGVILTGFYADDRIIPIDQAVETFCQEADVELILPSTADLLGMLLPDSPSYDLIRDLAAWIDELDVVTLDELAIPVHDVELLVPIGQPRKIFLLAGNYAQHVVERGGTAAERDETFPYVFMKPPTALTAPGAPVILPRISPDHVDWECELGVVIGQHCRNVEEQKALECVAGYTVINDISDRMYRPNPRCRPRERDRFFEWMLGKWHDTFCPIGPCLLSADAVDDPQDLALRLTVNGEVKQEATTAQMIFPVAAIVSFLSRLVTLEPGDIISTGTPSGVGSATGTYLRPGDVIRATISGIGTLENPVVAEE